jgi:hypothetical protein
VTVTYDNWSMTPPPRSLDTIETGFPAVVGYLAHRGRRLKELPEPSHIGGGLPLEQPGHQQPKRTQETKKAALHHLGKAGAAGPVGSTRREPCRHCCIRGDGVEAATLLA